MISSDKITSIRIQGMRAIDDIKLDLDGLTVLIGDNGTGKSTIIEALEILRKSAFSPFFINEVISRQHGGINSLLRQGSKKLCWTVRVESESDAPLEYTLALGREGDYAIISDETLNDFVDGSKPEPLKVIIRSRSSCKIYSLEEKRLIPFEVSSTDTVLTSFGKHAPRAILRMMNALNGIQVHVPFDVRPQWLGQEQQPQSQLRSPIAVDRAEALERSGLNIANCFHMLKNSLNDVEWKDLLLQAKGGLGEDLEDILTPPFIRGQIELRLKFRGLKAIPASQLSDGQLSFLAMIVLVELGKNHGLVAFDEPETHLHPALIARMVWMFEELGKYQPVILATHSDRLLDMLSEPARSVILCELDNHRSTVIKRPDKAKLDNWLNDYRGIGSLRAEGYDALVFDENKAVD